MYLRLGSYSYHSYLLQVFGLCTFIMLYLSLWDTQVRVATLYICYSAFWHIRLCTRCTEVVSWQMWPAIRGQFLWSAGSSMALVRVMTAGILSPTLPPPSLP